MVVRITTAPDAAPSSLHATIGWLYAAATSLSPAALEAALNARLAETPVPENNADTVLAWHLKHASAACQSRPDDANAPGHADVSLDGEVRQMDDAFEAYMRQAVPNWPGKLLPFRIFWTDSLPYHGMTFARLFIRVRATDDGYALVVREDQRVNVLSRREQEVAQLVADGQTFKQVAETLGLAISTVSTHLYRVYDKLDISSRSELVQWMREHHQTSES
ncbi:response regulator transcription factor [bacterium]|nr:response regulator transcription factor [bacterium]